MGANGHVNRAAPEMLGVAEAFVGAAPVEQVLRHEVALITVKPARAGLDRLFHQPFPTGTCVVVFCTTGCEAAGTMKPHPSGGGQPTARGADDW